MYSTANLWKSVVCQSYPDIRDRALVSMIVTEIFDRVRDVKIRIKKSTQVSNTVNQETISTCNMHRWQVKR